jgi:uncharacterized membrane protein YdjX (TVP38/TMEM64 family)
LSMVKGMTQVLQGISYMDQTGNAPGGDRWSDWWKPAVLLVFIIAAVGFSRFFNVGERLLDIRFWIESRGILGMVVFVLIYAAGAVAVVPGAFLTVAGGAIFGSVRGVIVVSIASTLGAALAFTVSRYFARGAIRRWLAGNSHFQRIDLLTERYGAVIVALTRLTSIVPYNLLNYAFGLTRIHFWTYLFWTWLCMLPVTVLLVVGADAFTIGIAGEDIPRVLIGIFVVVLILLVFLVRISRKKLKERERQL